MKRIVFCLFVIMFMFAVGENVFAAEKYLLKVNTEGLGQISVVPEGNIPEFSDDRPMQSAVENAEEGTKFTVGAQPFEGWKFVKWTSNGTDFSVDDTVDIEITKDINLIAVFESTENDVVFEQIDLTSKKNSITNVTKDTQTSVKQSNNMVLYIVIGVVTFIVIIAVVAIVKAKKD